MSETNIRKLNELSEATCLPLLSAVAYTQRFADNSKNGKPTKPNKTKKATASDSVQTRAETAEWIVRHFEPEGTILEPCRGDGAFYRVLPNGTEWCEIREGRDFFDWTRPVDWIITNPPYSIYDHFLQHAFEVAENVVFFVPIAKAFKSNTVQRMVIEYGGLKELVYMGGGQRHGFAFGFPVGCLHYQRGFVGDCRIIHKLN